MPYRPSEEILERYARVLVRFALHGGEGVRAGEVVRLSVGEEAKPLYVALRNEVLRAGALPLTDYRPAGVSRELYELSSLEQLARFHRPYMRGIADTIDAQISILSTVDPRELEGVEPEKLLALAKSAKPYGDWLERKEAEGRYSWTLALYGTPAMAKEARTSLQAYWQQIVDACFLDDPDPVARWRETQREIARLKRRLDRLEIESLHVEADGVDLRVGLGPGRRWLGGTGRNIPSFEVFVSPDARLTEGEVAFSEPLYRYGTLVEGIRLRFAGGEVVEAEAAQNEDVLLRMLDTDPGARRLGEFSLTDGRLSRISRFMAETLYDENRGGTQGNFHVALGRAYLNSYPADPATVRKSEWRRLGYNSSAVHCDIVSTTRRTVTATLPGGRRKLIYADGQFRL